MALDPAAASSGAGPICRLTRLVGCGSNSSLSAAGPVPCPPQAVEAPGGGAQPIPTAQQLASNSAAARNKMHFEIIMTYDSALAASNQVKPAETRDARQRTSPTLIQAHT